MSFSKTNKPVLVIDVGSYNIKFIIATSNGSVLNVQDAFTANTPEGAYSDGVILDHNALVETIKQALRIHSVKNKQVYLTFSSTDVITRNWTVPKLSNEDMIGMIRYEISQYLPINVDEYDVTYKILSTVFEDDVEKYNLIAYIAKKTMVSSLYKLMLDCDLTPVGLDVHSNSISKLMEFERFDTFSDSNDLTSSGSDLATVFIDIGYKNILVNVFSKTDTLVGRVISKGISGLDKMISDKLKISLEKAEELRIKKITNNISELYEIFDKIKYIDFNQPEIDKSEFDLGSGLMNSEEKVLFDLLRDSMVYLSDMASEINKVLRYYLSRNKENKIGLVLYHGSAMDNKGLFDFFATNIEFEARRLDFDKMNSVKFVNDITYKASYANAVGGVLRKKEL